MEWREWLLYFERSCRDGNKDNIIKYGMFKIFQKGRALKLYINNSLNVLHWEELIQLFTEEFTTLGELSLIDFSDIRFKTGRDAS